MTKALIDAANVKKGLGSCSQDSTKKETKYTRVDSIATRQSQHQTLNLELKQVRTYLF